MVDFIQHAFILLGSALGLLLVSILWLAIILIVSGEIVSFYKAFKNYEEDE